MKQRIHGILSLLMALLAILIGIFITFYSSISMGIFYLITCIISLPIILYSYCAKCPSRHEHCGHMIPGLLTRFLPSRREGKYTLRDFLGAIVPFILILGVPQTVLWNHKILFFVFWVLLIVAAMEIRICVCVDCQNINCPVRTFPKI